MLVLLPATWQSQAGRAVSAEKEALYRYLYSQDCRRACLSEYLDLEPYWR